MLVRLVLVAARPLRSTSRPFDDPVTVLLAALGAALDPVEKVLDAGRSWLARLALLVTFCVLVADGSGLLDAVAGLLGPEVFAV
ncbi:hypothetical protein GCM10022254_01810 [Actinomadura meridiana]|uniref:Uncharacterized protein n=1 Tax=Actinomadura meridiana TaxID=559626 RepID=A0ABP8BRJ4_9ACTN